MKKVSIIVPVYNKEKYIKECLDSLVNQTLKDIEIIVIDDCSKDNSYEILKQYQKKYNNIMVIKNEKNMGIGKTRNIGLSKVKGEYVGFVDSDDYVDKKMYQKYYEFAKKNDLDLVTGDYKKVFENNKKIIKTPYFEICNIKTNPNIINLIEYGPCNKIFKTSLLKENNILFEENLKYEDMPFVFKSIYNSRRIGNINESFYNYRITSSSETTTMDKRVFDMFKIMDIVNSYQKNKNEELEYLNINQITRYMLQQKYQKDEILKNIFINQGYDYLYKINPKWKRNKYYKKTSLLKRIVKNNKFMLKCYCDLYVYLHR